MNPLIKQLQSLNLLSAPGDVLDLGSGQGSEAIELAKLGHNVTAVDSSAESVEKLSLEKGALPITTFKADIRSFNIEPNTYSLIIAKNSLPFLSSKEEVFKVIESISTGLKADGILYITLFGPNDAWAKEKPDMTFIDYQEAISFLESLGLHSIHRQTEEGLGTTMKGTLKYWHIHKFLYKK